MTATVTPLVTHSPDVRVVAHANGTGYVPACTCGAACIETFGSHDNEQDALDEAADLLNELVNGPVDPLLSDPVSARLAAPAPAPRLNEFDEPIDYWPTTLAEQHRSAFALKMELNS